MQNISQSSENEESKTNAEISIFKGVAKISEPWKKHEVRNTVHRSHGDGGRIDERQLAYHPCEFSRVFGLVAGRKGATMQQRQEHRRGQTAS